MVLYSHRTHEIKSRHLSHIRNEQLCLVQSDGPPEFIYFNSPIFVPGSPPVHIRLLQDGVLFTLLQLQVLRFYGGVIILCYDSHAHRGALWLRRLRQNPTGVLLKRQKLEDVRRVVSVTESYSRGTVCIPLLGLEEEVSWIPIA